MLLGSGNGGRRGFKAACERLGFPIMVKASLGGGGRGLRVVESAAAVAEAFARCSSEAAGPVFLEKLLPRPKHIEVQVP